MKTLQILGLLILVYIFWVRRSMYSDTGNSCIYDKECSGKCVGRKCT